MLCFKSKRTCSSCFTLLVSRALRARASLAPRGTLLSGHDFFAGLLAPDLVRVSPLFLARPTAHRDLRARQEEPLQCQSLASRRKMQGLMRPVCHALIIVVRRHRNNGPSTASATKDAVLRLAVPHDHDSITQHWLPKNL